MNENVIGVGMPGWILLNLFGRLVYEAFGHHPYLVGSAAQGKTWRDVDVRLILDDDEFWQLFPPKHNSYAGTAPCGTRLAAFELAFANLGREMTGMPIDFQIQTVTHANGQYGRGATDGDRKVARSVYPRVPLGLQIATEVDEQSNECAHAE